LMFGMDFPHPEGTWPNTREWLQLALRDVSEDEARRFLGANAIECYGLDADLLGKVAAKIGLFPEEILQPRGGVSDALIAQFHARSGFRRPAEHVDDAFYEEMIEDDLASLSGITSGSAHA
jgi:hypothetical protein